ncbi:ATP-binding protein [Actinocorallia sp. API 0066]|uniref:ATP-binding protein n=1 Tax=Actinocorallia sp. API 0066 TaxID=2896846 RepID=UPI001E2CF3A2|nr:ATP-binding protein [Actinocorallia sp. API 0066]MCD0450607.1 ATP-binding protein [Actinocorallia sp. API 0066]
MATVEVAFSALPIHVRTARMVTRAVAVRSGVAEPLLDEVRLAVGEACSRAVEAHQKHCPEEPVRLALTEGGGRFSVAVSDRAQAAPAEEDGLSMAVIKGLADELEIASSAEGTTLTMSWPAR